MRTQLGFSALALMAASTAYGGLGLSTGLKPVLRVTSPHDVRRAPPVATIGVAAPPKQTPVLPFSHERARIASSIEAFERVNTRLQSGSMNAEDASRFVSSAWENLAVLGSMLDRLASRSLVTPDRASLAELPHLQADLERLETHLGLDFGQIMVISREARHRNEEVEAQWKRNFDAQSKLIRSRVRRIQAQAELEQIRDKFPRTYEILAIGLNGLGHYLNVRTVERVREANPLEGGSDPWVEKVVDALRASDQELRTAGGRDGLSQRLIDLLDSELEALRASEASRAWRASENRLRESVGLAKLPEFEA